MQPENSPDFPSHDQWLDGDWLTYGGSSSGNHRLFSSSFDSSSFDFIDQKPKTTNRKSLSASENHKEAERRRRERINGHLDSLRAILLCNSKIDKASLLAKVVERVRELKRETSDIFRFDQSSFPSEADESTVVLQDNDDSVENGRSMFKASLCCEDRVNLLPELIDILKPLPLSIVSAEIVTLGGRVRNVIVLAGERNRETDEAVLSLESSLQTMVQRSSFVDGERMKRRRMFDQMIVG